MLACNRGSAGVLQGRAQTEFDKNLIKKNTATFESLGYEVVHVPTNADGLRGGIHCLINVID